MAAYYNEIDPFAAQWLRNLVAQNLIAPGDVDTRSIEDVSPDDLKPYAQCHFFAGIAGWSLALRNAGWSDDRAVWTGSCPCQPFSTAGKGAGFTDERHLWPAFFHLIQHRRPAIVFGEQVASKDALAWFDLVQTDLEAENYAARAVDLCAAGVGAPHIRQRMYWVAAQPGALADATRERKRADESGRDRGDRIILVGAESGRYGSDDGATSSVADSESYRSDSRQPDIGRRNERDGSRETIGLTRNCATDGAYEQVSAVANANDPRPQGHGKLRDLNGAQNGSTTERHGASGSLDNRTSAVNGFWRTADWLYCRDNSWRPVEPALELLVNGFPGRVGQLRAYGNAIVPQVAAEVIAAYMEIAQ